MKALIIGPDNTPYENGCFIFDILLGPAYNQSPPQVKIVTTLGGKYRLNPNLYAEGKVCLSLLGTWSGEWLVSVGVDALGNVQIDEAWVTAAMQDLAGWRENRPSCRFWCRSRP